MSRRVVRMLGSIAVICLGCFSPPLAGTAAAGPKTLTFATTMPPKSNLEIASQRFVDAIAEKTGGRISIKHYGTGSLYNAKTIMPALSNGQIDMGILHVALVGRRSPALEFIGSFGAQGCWEGFDHYYRFVDNPRVREIASAEFDKYFRSRLLGALAFGTALVGRTDEPITAVEDYRGLKIRTSGSAQATLYKALGAIPVALSSKEIYTGLQRGTIDAATSGVSRWRRSKLYEVAPYLTVDPTIPYFSMWLVISNRAWNALPDADRRIFTETAREMERWARDYAAKEREEDLAFLKENAKALVELPRVEKDKLVRIAVPVMKGFAKEQLGGQFEELWGLMESSR